MTRHISPFSALERLSDRKEELKMAHGLRHAFAGLRATGIHACVDQFLQSALEPSEARRIDAIGQIHADRADGCSVADPETHRMHHVIEIRKIVLVKTE